MMKLELGLFHIKNIVKGGRTFIQDQTLFVNINELKELVANDRCFSRVEFKIVHPGESVRIINVLDVLEPRIKVEGGGTFPGWTGEMGLVGMGKTYALRGVGIIEAGFMRDTNGGILDMKGPGSELTNYSNLHHIVLIVESRPTLSLPEYSHSLKMAGLKVATYLANASITLQPDEWKVYEIPPLNQASGETKLPRIAYLYITECHETLKEPFIYGDNPKRFFPTIFHPNEFMDGAMVSCLYNYSPGLKNFSHSIMNNPIIEGLYERHGKELMFVGVVVANAQLKHSEKKRTALMATKLIKYTLGADGVIISKEGGGHPDIDLIECCEQCESLGVRTSLINFEMLSPDGKGIPMVAFSKFADCIVSVGNVDEMVNLPSVERVIGGREMSIGIKGPFEKPIRIPIRLIPNAISPIGFTKLTGEEF